MDDVGLTLRRATAGDVAALVELAASTFRDTYLPWDDPEEIEGYIAEHFTESVLGGAIDDPEHRLLLAEANGACVGYAHVKPSPSPACVDGPAPRELKRFYLRHSHHGRGYGAALMRAVVDAAATTGAQTLWLCVYSRNVRARAFYARCGFAETGVTEFVFAGRSYYDPVMAVAVERLP